MQKSAEISGADRKTHYAPTSLSILSILFGRSRPLNQAGNGAENAQPVLNMECFMLGNFATMEPAKLGGGESLR